MSCDCDECPFITFLKIMLLAGGLIVGILTVSLIYGIVQKG
jgi:hypothetical protein